MTLQALNTYLAALAERGAGAIARMAPGRKLGAEFADCEGVVLPPSVIALWSRMNGVADWADSTYDDLWLDGQFFYFSIEEAREDYQVTLDLIANDPDLEDYFPTGFIPIGKPGDGSRLLVNARDGSPTYGSVYDLQHGIGVSTVARSLDAYFDTLTTCLSQGALFVNDARQVDVDFDTLHEIGRTMNPDCGAYDPSLPPAYETMEWK